MGELLPRLPKTCHKDEGNMTLDTFALVVKLLTALPSLITLVKDVRDEIEKDDSALEKVRDMIDAAEAALQEVERVFPAAARNKEKANG